MVGFVVVSHSENLAESIVELTGMMAPGVPIAGAGGLEDGTFGTSLDRISKAIFEVYSEDGVIILVDMGSAVMTAEMAIENMAGRKIKIADCPIVEGAIAGTVDSVSGLSMEEILEDLEEIRYAKKL
jgi:dihydroxyacetone kinase phosphotransfer subunit